MSKRYTEVLAQTMFVSSLERIIAVKEKTNQDAIHTVSASTFENDTLLTEHTFFCPHQKQLKVVTLLGLSIYYHDEDTVSCSLMNRLETSADLILLTQFNTVGLVDTPVVRAALTASIGTRTALYRVMSSKTGDDLVHMLQTFLVLAAKTSGEEELIRDLVITFGDTVIRNIQRITGQDFTRYHANRKKVLPMQELVMGDMQELQKKIAAQKAKKAQMMSDILI